MSEPQNFSTPAETPTREETAPTTNTAAEQPEVPSTQEPTTTEQPAVAKDTAMPETNTETAESAPAAEKKDDPIPTEKSIEPISEGQLSYKGPGLLKSLIPSKKEFWISDTAVPPQELNTYMRGEKQEIANPVVAWASQSGKGLLFFNKKGDTTRKQPGGVFALYDAIDLKKQHPHEILFKLNGHEHTLKAANDTERDGWYISLEKAVELGKASKEQIRDSEGYKAEMEKLNKPNVPAVGAAGVAKKAPHQSQPKKSVEENSAEATDGAKRAGSDNEDNKKQKSRSTSRGILNRLKSKQEEKKEEKAAEKEEKEAEKEEPKSANNDKEAGEAAAAGAAATAGAAAFDAHGTADRAVGAPVEESKEPAGETSAPVDTLTEQPKPSKRGSIFGKMQGWGSMKSPAREKDQKEAELKPEVPMKDNVVSDNPPQLPETTTASQPTEVAAAPVLEAGDAGKASVEPKTEAAKEDSVSPNTEKKNFLSGLPFMNKRNRSVSPSAAMKETPAKKEEGAPSVPPKDDVPEPVAKEEPVAETTPAPVTTEAEDVPAEKAEEPAKTETPTSNKRQSMLGSLGRRASKAFNRMQSPKKENTAPTSETKPTEAQTDKPTTNGESSAEPQEQQALGGDAAASETSRPEQTPTVAATA